MLPEFIIGGVMKSGTTFLHNLLMHHPEIKIIPRNMNHAYFDDDRIYIRGEAWYTSLFDHVKNFENKFVIGQTSADCAFNPNSIERILKHNKNTKLIFVLRHPVDRAYSLYWHQYSMGREFRRFEEALKTEPELIKKSYYNFKNYSYIERSRYKKQFEKIIRKIPEENLLLIDFVSLTKQTKKTINAVLNFLNISEITDLEKLNYSTLPRNSAKIPSNHFVVQISAGLQRFGLRSLGRRLVSLFRQEIKPPKMNIDLRLKLEKELAEDINFYKQVETNFNKQIN